MKSALRNGKLDSRVGNKSEKGEQQGKDKDTEIKQENDVWRSGAQMLT